MANSFARWGLGTHEYTKVEKLLNEIQFNNVLDEPNDTIINELVTLLDYTEQKNPKYNIEYYRTNLNNIKVEILYFNVITSRLKNVLTKIFNKKNAILTLILTSQIQKDLPVIRNHSIASNKDKNETLKMLTELNRDFTLGLNFETKGGRRKTRNRKHKRTRRPYTRSRRAIKKTGCIRRRDRTKEKSNDISQHECKIWSRVSC